MLTLVFILFAGCRGCRLCTVDERLSAYALGLCLMHVPVSFIPWSTGVCQIFSEGGRGGGGGAYAFPPYARAESMSSLRSQQVSGTEKLLVLAARLVKINGETDCG